MLGVEISFFEWFFFGMPLEWLLPVVGVGLVIGLVSWVLDR